MKIISFLVKRFFGFYLDAREFERHIELIEGLQESEYRYQVRLSRRHMDLLKACAALGIKNSGELMDRLKLADRADGWVSVEESLPKYGTEVWASDGKYVDLGFRSTEDGDDKVNWHDFHFRVTHWKLYEVPNPPK